MGKGFGVDKSKKKLKVYASFNTEEKNIITAIEELGYKHGEHFLLDKRTYKIHATQQFLADVDKLISTLTHLNSEQAQVAIQQIRDGIKLIEEVSATEFQNLVREATMWKTYKVLYGAQPPLIDNLFYYSIEQLEPLLEKHCELLNSETDDFEASIKIFTDYIIPFWNSLEKKGYIYDFLSAPE